MARAPREISKTGIYHVIIRGVNKQIIFQDDGDRKKLTTKMKEDEELGRYEVYSYCLMDNHIHLLLKEMDDDISSAVQRISAFYASWYNEKYDRYGHLFQGRFKSEVVESDPYLLTVIRYIHNNPVQAKMVKRPENYIWSSYNDYISDKDNVKIDFILKQFSSNKKTSIKLFKEFHLTESKDNCLEVNDKKILTDSELIDVINDLGINIQEIGNLDKANKYDAIRRLKSIEGTTMRQISRITGISKSSIGRI